MAGAVGIEPTLTVLETGVLPLYEAPRLNNYIKFLLIMQVIDILKNQDYFLGLVFTFECLTMGYHIVCCFVVFIV